VNPLARYARWLHTRWPAGRVEKLPRVDEHGRSNVPGVYVAGDLAGIPLLKFSVDTGARAVRHMAADPALAALRSEGGAGVVDLLVLGAGVAGASAALEARRLGLSCAVLEAGTLAVTATVKEELVAELAGQAERGGVAPLRARAIRVRPRGRLLEVELAPGGGIEGPLRARRVLVAIGRSGDFRRLGVPGEERSDKVFNRLHDPRDFAGKDALVVGGGDSALETAIALTLAGARVTLAHRGDAFARAKPENVDKVHRLAADPAADVAVEAPTSERETTAMTPAMVPAEAVGTGRLVLRPGTVVERIGAADVALAGGEVLPNDVVFVMIGRDAPLEFLRRSGLAVRGEMRAPQWAAFAAFLAFCTALYNWKSGGVLDRLTREAGAFPYSIARWMEGAAVDPHSWPGVILVSAQGPSFWYTVAYSLLVVIFGVRRIRRRRTPYVTAQTLAVMAIQVVPLFLLPEIVLPWMHHHGLLPAGIADALFPAATYGHGREFWRAYGLILAWPLNVYNIFTPEPLWAWIGIGILQTLIVIPLLVWRFGKGAYCGWICSCGALAETLGDTHREKMPHGPAWNRLNLLGQAVLAVAVILLAVRVFGWTQPPDGPVPRWFDGALQQYKWTVDVFLAGVIGYGAYFWFSGRTWCRFACPLAAWMHVVARFSRFRIFAEKAKCISCNVCTSVCHQGIDVMNFANKGLPMDDPQCVRCSACVQSCPTGVLSFGAIDPRTGAVAGLDRLEASPVRIRLRALEGPARKAAR
jgi:NosR/NirI family nitrous oxide reductase transcriptional regulator